MKNNYFIFIVLCFILFTSCNSEKDNKATEERIEADTLIIITEPIRTEINTSEDAIGHLDSIVSTYSIEQRHEYPIDSILTKKALLKLRYENEDSLKCYVTWFMLRKYRFHLECCNQGYNLRSDMGNSKIDSLSEPILYEFLLFSDSFEGNNVTKEMEFINSGIAMTYLEENLDLLDFDPIAREYDKLLKIFELMDDPDFDVIQPDYYKVYE